MNFKIGENDDEWKKILTPEQYKVLRQKATEIAFSGQYWNHFENGIYCCAGCGVELFSSDYKFKSLCGWPSFSKAIKEDVIKYEDDYSYGMNRIEVLCSNCGGHLGHLFNDGPKPTGLRYCINSIALKFIKR